MRNSRNWYGREREPAASIASSPRSTTKGPSRSLISEGAYLIGRTPVGRVTVAVLGINDPFRVALREALIEEGVFPPD